MLSVRYSSKKSSKSHHCQSSWKCSAVFGLLTRIHGSDRFREANRFIFATFRCDCARKGGGSYCRRRKKVRYINAPLGETTPSVAKYLSEQKVRHAFGMMYWKESRVTQSISERERENILLAIEFSSFFFSLSYSRSFYHKDLLPFLYAILCMCFISCCWSSHPSVVNVYVSVHIFKNLNEIKIERASI
jgi:hypothetical protein